jgi:hypothetical protein
VKRKNIIMPREREKEREKKVANVAVMREFI